MNETTPKDTVLMTIDEQNKSHRCRAQSTGHSRD